MTTANVVVSALDVGQGQSTFVEIYDDADKLTNTLLFDIGSTNSRRIGTGAIDYVTDKVISMDAPCIDFLSLSHKDADHINMLGTLLEAIEDKITAPKTFRIAQVRYGGSLAWYNRNTIRALKEVLADPDNDLQRLELHHTCYVNTPPVWWVPIWNQNDVYVYIILANVPTPNARFSEGHFASRRPDSELANAVSIISSIWWNDSQFVTTGDATYITIQEANRLDGFIPRGTRPAMLTLPHHGSRKTTLGLPSSCADASAESRDTVNTFARRINAKTAIASAENKHGHPSLDMILLFNQYTNLIPWFQDTNLGQSTVSGHLYYRHFVTAYMDVDATDILGHAIDHGYVSFETTMNVYSTLYFDPSAEAEYTVEPVSGSRKRRRESVTIPTFTLPPRNPVGAGTTWAPPLTPPRPVFAKGLQWIYAIDSDGAVTLTPRINRVPELASVTPLAKTRPPPAAIPEAPPRPRRLPVQPAVSVGNLALQSLRVFR